MIAILLAAEIVASAPPLAPAEAAQTLARLDSPANLTGQFVMHGLRRPAARDRALAARRWSIRTVPFASVLPPTELLLGLRHASAA